MDPFETALSKLLDGLRAAEPVQRNRVAGEIAELLQAVRQQPVETQEPRHYDRSVRPVLRARLLTGSEEAALVEALRDAFLAISSAESRGEDGRVSMLNAIACARPSLATRGLLDLLIAHVDGLSDRDLVRALTAPRINHRRSAK